MREGEGPFLWLSDRAPPRGFRQLPSGGMCISAFLFVERDGKILLGKYADDSRWEDLAGLDADRWRAHGKGWTIPGTQLRYGEEPLQAAGRIAEEHLLLPGLTLGEPRVATDTYVPRRFPELGLHYDIWFLVDAALPKGTRIETPPWYAALEWHDPRVLRREDCARSHEDVVARWLSTRAQ